MPSNVKQVNISSVKIPLFSIEINGIEQTDPIASARILDYPHRLTLDIYVYLYVNYCEALRNGSLVINVE